MDERIKELFNMCRDSDFSESRAEELLDAIDVNEPYGEGGDQMTLLSEACLCTNLKMARLLLEKGADPNYILFADRPLRRENPFWDLQYNVYDDEFYESSEENKKIADAADEDNLEIARLCLEYGANPSLTLEGEDLFSYVLFAVVENEDDFRMTEYRRRFLILLVAYGGKSKYCRPQIFKPFDKSNMRQYRLYLFRNGNCDIVDDNHETVAVISGE